MPILVTAAAQGAVEDVVAASPGYRVDVAAPADTDTAGIPPGGDVVAWALIADDEAAGGAHLEPMFLAAGQVWTPAQFREMYGQTVQTAVTTP